MLYLTQKQNNLRKKERERIKTENFKSKELKLIKDIYQ